MARAFLKAVMAGTLASVAVPWLIVLLVVFVDQGRAGTSVAFIVVVITILTMLIVLTGAL